VALREIAGLWKGETKSGEPKLAGKCKQNVTLPADARLLVLQNKSTAKGAPDYRLFVQVPDDEEPGDGKRVDRVPF